MNIEKAFYYVHFRGSPTKYFFVFAKIYSIAKFENGMPVWSLIFFRYGKFSHF